MAIDSGWSRYNCKWTITNTEAGDNYALFKHSGEFEEYTYSVTLKVESDINKGCAILFSLQASLSGYMFIVTGGQQYHLGKWVTIGTTTSFSSILGNFSSFINDDYNTLKVSKKGGEISLFCNGAFLEKITDTDFGKGSIGIGLGGGETVAFDHAVVTDNAEVGEYKTWFSDDFEDGDLQGWRLIQGGPATTANGVLKINPSVQTLFYTNGNYKDMPCTTIVSNVGGSASTYYGIAFMSIQPGVAVDAYYYVINGNKNYSLQTSQGGAVGSNSFIHGTTDTLIVTKDYEFIANGQLIDDTTFSGGKDFNAVGVYVDAGVSVEFDNFRAGNNDGTAIKTNPQNLIFSKAKPSYILGGSGIIYDTRGRKVATFENGYKAKLKNLGAGPYFIVIPNGGKDHIIRRAVINTQ